VSVTLAALTVVSSLVGFFSFAGILADGLVARTFGLSAFVSATDAVGAGIFAALPPCAPADAGADTATSGAGGVILALDVRLLRGFGVSPSGFASTLVTATAAGLATGAR
jgi:hypothetical protein